MGGDEKKAWQMWEDSTPVKEDAPAQSSSEEKRINKDDKSKTPYTYKDFVEFNKGDEKKAWQMWEDSTPAKDDKWGKESAEEKRVHPSDKAKQAYSYNEYLEFSKG